MASLARARSGRYLWQISSRLAWLWHLVLRNMSHSRRESALSAMQQSRPLGLCAAKGKPLQLACGGECSSRVSHLHGEGEAAAVASSHAAHTIATATAVAA
jgi:hypothetical protein